ncbi:hypothetical protein T484DRAFT_1899521 [Baffinella frigidus]|nr:hypothetical protein T484DRAFT_1899521 [Cryptophyta sp. CCMP2293]
MLRKNPPAAILLALAFVPTLSGFASSGENLQLSSAANGLRCFEAAPARDRHALSRCSPEHTRAEGVESGARSRGDSVPGRWANHCREAGSDRAEGQGLAGARDAMLYLRGGGQEEEDETQKLNRPAHAAFKGFDPHTEIRTCAKMRSSEMRHVKNGDPHVREDAIL